MLGAPFASSLRAADDARSAPGTYLNVRDLGARGDGTTDDTAALQKALEAAGQAGGGIVFVPTGNYLIKGHLVVPDNVTLEGVFRAPTARSQNRGTTLPAVEGQGKADGEPFIFLHANSVLKGVTVFYPEQNQDAPVPYPWCVRGIGDNGALLDTLLVNPWQGVDLATFPCGRHLVRGLYGQPLKTGLFIDNCLDCGRLEDIHFWPFWTEKLIPFTQREGTAFLIARTDWEMISNCFCLGYRVGFEFTSAGHDGPNCLITNSGPDVCLTGVLVRVSQVRAGIVFANCQINAGVVVTPEVGGKPLLFAGLFGIVGHG
jgi:hypothetical protein